MHYDIIGDIHGHADKLEKLLHRLGYTKGSGTFRANDRQAIFVGDLIDRGEQNRQVIDLVRRMVEDGQAYAIMGNHEYNAICYHTASSTNGYLRPWSQKNKDQHRAFLKEFPPGAPHTKDVITWFKTLPLFRDFDHFRVIHACWDSSSIKAVTKYLNTDNTLREEHLADSATKGQPLFELIERLLKGVEVKLPKPYTFKDKGGALRNSIRMKWWCQSTNLSYRELAFGYRKEVIDTLPDDHRPGIKSDPLYQDSKPVFFGHYWLWGKQKPQQDNICCLDYSAGDGGKLAAYQFSEEDARKPLSSDRFMVHE